MLTPFHENGEIDFEGLGRLTEFYVEAGASGLFANCLSSEMFELTENERLQVIKQTIKSASGLPVVATGSFGNSLQEQADFVKKVYDTGADAVIILANAIAESHETDEVFEDRMMALLDLTENIPLGLYECPVPYKRLVSADILSRLSRTGRVIYHKDTCLDIEQIKAKIKATEGKILDFMMLTWFMLWIL
jgi:4-hydroxy-tetrahydrodipicolinate synthase